MHHKLNRKVLRLDCDVNGNPRYYIAGLTLACILSVNFSQLKANQEYLKLPTYKGRKYGLVLF